MNITRAVISAGNAPCELCVLCLPMGCGVWMCTEDKTAECPASATDNTSSRSSSEAEFSRHKQEDIIWRENVTQKRRSHRWGGCGVCRVFIFLLLWVLAKSCAEFRVHPGSSYRRRNNITVSLFSVWRCSHGKPSCDGREVGKKGPEYINNHGRASAEPNHFAHGKKKMGWKKPYRLNSRRLSVLKMSHY